MRIMSFSVNFEGQLEKVFYLIEDTGLPILINNSYLNEYETYEVITSQKRKKIINVEMDAFMYSLLESALESSVTCRCILFKNVASGSIHVNINVSLPKRQLIDKRGNKLFEISCLERRELDNAMAWFSTLGGAFSALGDQIEHCAIMAGKISQQQFQLALRLGDPNLVSQCKLYMALSLIQQKRFSEAKFIIKSQYVVAKQQKERVKRLLSMCQGIWSKWKYEKKLAKLINSN